jgi:hypothetical protein
MQQHSPVDEDIAAAQSGRMDEIIAEREVLCEILVRSVGRHHTQVVFVLQQTDGEEKEGRRERNRKNKRIQR